MAFDLVRAVSFYALAGCVHELAHVLAYAFVVLGGVSDFGAVSFACPVEQHGGVYLQGPNKTRARAIEKVGGKV